MAFSATCPSCGAPVVFKSAGSILAVCEYCQSTLIRHDQALEDLGCMAALAEDRSPLQLGAEGSYRGEHFALIGRIQLRYRQGLWNEWHLLFDDGRTGWLSEAAGEYALTFLRPLAEPVPELSALHIGQRLTLASQSWTVSSIELAECVAGQGELPFKVGGGYPVSAVDLRQGRNFATLDYSETPPLCFVGQTVPLAALQLRGLRDAGDAPPPVEARVFRCPSCGAPVQARSADILALACAACGSVVDVGALAPRLLSPAREAQARRYTPRLPLGATGRLEGEPVEVIGFLVRQCTSDGIDSVWSEYLLAAGPGRYRWLTESAGHWTLADVLSDPPATPARDETAEIRYAGESFRHFSTVPSARVVHVAGEFTWRVCRGETARVVDYVAPPRLLSRESTASDLTWTLATYIEPAVIAEAFGLAGKLPAPVGVYLNQPNPWTETHRATCRRFWRLALAAVVLQALLLSFFGERVLLRQPVEFAPQAAGEAWNSPEFTVSGAPRRIVVRHATTLDNNWLGLELTLVNKATGAAWPATRELSYFHGREGNDAWSEGSRDDEVVFPDVPAGNYALAVDPEINPEMPAPVRGTLEIATGGAGWSNFALLLLFLAIFPLLSRTRCAAFEARRWRESDHPPETGDEGDDGADSGDGGGDGGGGGD